jgi:hypothetical protein
MCSLQTFTSTAGTTGEMRAGVDLDCGQTLMMQSQKVGKVATNESKLFA